MNLFHAQSNILPLGKIVKCHYLAILFAFVVGVLVFLPNILAPIALGETYEGIPFFFQSDALDYMSQIQDIVDGHPLATSPYLYEYKDEKSTIFPVGEYFYALPSFIFNISPSLSVLLGQFLFPALLFLFVYAFCYRLLNDSTQRSKSVQAVAAGMLVIFGYHFIDYRSIISMITSSEPIFMTLVWSRPINPITGALLLFPFLILLWGIFNAQSEKKRIIYTVAGTIFALLMFGYIFSYGIGMATAFVLFCISLLQKKITEAKHFFALIALAALPFVYLLANIFLRKGSSGGLESLTRNGLLITHTPLLNKLLLISIVGLVVLYIFSYYKNKENLLKEHDWWTFSFALLGGVFIAFNQQVITGYTVWPQHFVQYSTPIIIIVGVVAFYNVIRPIFPILWRVGVVIMMTTPFLFGVWSVLTYKTMLENYEDIQRYEGVFSWINKNAPHDCVVLSPETTTIRLSDKIPAFTHCNTYYSKQTFYGVPLERVEHNYMVMLKMRGVDPQNIEEYLLENEQEMRGEVYEDWKQRFWHKNDPWLKSIRDDKKIKQWRDETILKLSEKYRLFVNLDFEKIVQKYRVDYVAWDSATNPLWDPNVLPSLRKVYDNRSVSVYSLSPR